MDWDSLLWISIGGTVATSALVTWIAHLGIRYKRELPKLPIHESIEALKLDRENREAKISELRDELSNAEETIREGERMQAWQEQSGPEIDALRKELSSLQTEKQRLDQLLQEIKHSQEELNGLRSKLEETRIQLAKTSATLEVERKEIQDVKKLKQECAYFEKMTPILRAERDGLVREVMEIRKDRRRLEEEIATIRKEHASLSGEIEGMRKTKEEILKAIQNLKKLKEQCVELEKRVPKLLSERDGLSRAIKEFRKDHQRLEGQIAPIRKEHAKLSGEIEGMRTGKKDLLKAIDMLQKSFQAAGGLSKDKDPCEDLWKPYFNEKRNAGGQSDELKRLEHMEQSLKSAGIRVPRRALYAFHTALKVQAISPLTVLAGISGTGKSLLPRLYAKCMGMHFLNLPVHPGWDSPQDLFGFYNYIEQKYKATSLARAMVQFDQFNRSHWKLPKDAPDLTDQVLLVLLDEMNLARIEYYFSELLSRLETRRSIKPSDAGERQKVEIPLEIGHGTNKFESIALYPGENVLFSGTMNEDESTQSISDKVLDRASVLRFGRPKEFITRQPIMDAIEASEPLGLEVWIGWQQREGAPGEYIEMINKIGNMMSEVDAPFGHRVAQGMIQYVSLYPDDSGYGKRCAMADQIEQKILPKIRGKDRDLVERKIEPLLDVVGELDDPELLKAIQQGLQNEQGAFLWTGLDRNEE